LRNDIGERNNLAAKDPARVKHLDALIEKFLNHTGAVRPIVNTKFNPALHRPEQEGVGRIRTKGKPARKKKRAANDSEFPGLKGWKARKVKYSVKNGVVRLTSRETTPYLGVTAGVSGPAQVTFQIRSPKGGKAKIEWLPTRDKAQSVPYETQGGDWQTITVDIPAKGPLGIFRIYVPAQSQTVEIDSIELRPVKGKPRGWDF
jgi:hypothetical protein